MNIYVGNLSYKVNEEDLEEIFKEYGSVNACRIITDKLNGRSRGFAFVEMENQEHANKAISELNGSSYENQDMIVYQAKPKTANYKRL